VNAADPNFVAAQGIAHGLLGGAAPTLDRVGGGRNSRIYRVVSGARTFALKQYFSRQGDLDRRLSAEVSALRLMEQRGIDTVARVLAVNAERGCVLLSWLDGTQVGAATKRDIDLAVAFLCSIHALKSLTEAGGLSAAGEACLCGGEVERQIRARLTRLKERACGETSLFDFLDGTFVPAFERMLATSRAQLSRAGISFAEALEAERRSLIPADFGFHNCLRRSDGTLCFVDFEYFGWDDPVKLTEDFLLHPGMTLTPAMRRHLRAGAKRCYGSDPTFGDRLKALQPLFGLRWVLILLNEFLPERWEQRVNAGASTSWEEAKAWQLGKARSLLARLGQLDKGAVE